MIQNLNETGAAKMVAKQIKADIDKYCVQTYDGGHRNHLGASLIGRDCSRYLWYVFRWCFREKFDGRMQRLFNRGHREEDRFIEWLRGIGFEVWTHDTTKEPNAKGEYPQFRISDCLGHFGGSLDGIAKFPERYGIAEPVLLEFKTNGTGRVFSDLCVKGMATMKPEHFAQTSTYGAKYNFNYVVYCNINKNDDDLHVEVAKLNENLGKQMIVKAERIIFSKVAPFRLSDNPTFFKCEQCGAKDICHRGALPEKNCRSCKHATPVEGAQWFCDVHGGNIPPEFIPQGCGNYTHITSSNA